MKKKSLLKILGITILVVIILTWIIPSSSFDGYSVHQQRITPTGIWDIFNALGMSIAYFWQVGLFILFIGGFYGVLHKTGSLKNLVDLLTKIFKEKGLMFLIITITLFAVFTSLTGIYFPFLIFVPFFMAVILSLGYSKLVALLCTVGSIIVGNISIMYNDLVYNVLQIEGNINLWYKLGLLLGTIAVLILFVWKTTKTKKSEQKEKVSDILPFMVEEKKSKKGKEKLWPLITAYSVLFVVFVLGMTKWVRAFDVNVFSRMHDWVMDVKIGNFYIFQNILGSSILPFGYWEITELFTVIIFALLFVGFFYKLSIKDMYESFLEGAKKVLPTAVMVTFINIVVILTLNSGFYTTVMNFFVGLTKNFNVITMSLNSFLGSILVIDNLYVSNYVINITANLLPAESSVELLSLINQTMYGMAMLVAPTSLVLIAGLSYLEVCYLDWLKYIWRLALILLGVVSIVLGIAYFI
ncbi:MAG: hypothetical protein ACOXZR_01500 [Bacilli bacterium]|jgi:uncharacterized ion transporter superfamily protein YfcC